MTGWNEKISSFNQIYHYIFITVVAYLTSRLNFDLFTTRGQIGDALVLLLNLIIRRQTRYVKRRWHVWQRSYNYRWLNWAKNTGLLLLSSVLSCGTVLWSCCGRLSNFIVDCPIWESSMPPYIQDTEDDPQAPYLYRYCLHHASPWAWALASFIHPDAAPMASEPLPPAFYNQYTKGSQTPEQWTSSFASQECWQGRWVCLPDL